MRPTYKKYILVILDVILFGYVIAAMVSFNKPDESQKVCSEVNIQIDDQNANGFLTAAEVKKILESNRMYPLKFKMTDIKPRQIEDLLCQSPFVNTAECYKTQDNRVYISITQRLPIIRIKNEKGDDYYLDDKGGIMPNSKYTSDLIIATGRISQSFAKNYIAPMANVIMENDMWKNLIEQINVLPDLGIEIVPRVGNHIVYLGNLPMTKNASKRQGMIREYITRKLTRLEKFYKYGLNQVGWNKYPYINLEFDNQIICKRQQGEPQETAIAAVSEQQSPTQAPVSEKTITTANEKKAEPTSEKKADKQDVKKKQEKKKTEKKESKDSDKKSSKQDTSKKKASTEKKSASSEKKQSASEKKSDSKKNKSDKKAEGKKKEEKSSKSKSTKSDPSKNKSDKKDKK